MSHMKALVKHGSTLSIQQVPSPMLSHSSDVLIRPRIVGICRTDIYVARGQLASADPVIPGHEFAGTVVEIGSGVTEVRPGDRVTVMPLIPCGKCAHCHSGLTTVCRSAQMLGVDLDGAFAELVKVPAHVVTRLPENVTLQQGAYSEPIAAALGVLKAGLRANDRGIIYGNNRFAVLVRAILRAHGLNSVGLASTDEPLPRDGFDFAIETVAREETLQRLMQAVKPFGKIIIRSRPASPVPIDLRLAVLKELTLRAVGYGSLSEGLALLAYERLDLSPLLGPVYPLEQFDEAFAQAEQDESRKHFFSLTS